MPVSIFRKRNHSMAGAENETEKLGQQNSAYDENLITKQNYLKKVKVNQSGPAHTQPTSSKLLNRSRVFMVIVVIAAIVFFSTAARIYAVDTANYLQTKQKECEKVYQNGKVVGLKLEDGVCDLPSDSFWLNLLQGAQAQSKLEKSTNDIGSRINNLQSLQDQKLMEYNSLRADLVNLQVPIESAEFVPSENLLNNLEQLELILQDLVRQKTDNLDKIESLLADYEKALAEGKNLPLSQEQAIFNDFKASSIDERITNFVKFKQSLDQLQKKLVYAKQVDLSLIDATRYKLFTPDDFQTLFENLNQSKVTSPISVSITGSSDADRRIIQIAQDRGYRLRPSAVESSLVGADGQRLQTEANLAWQKMKEAAATEGIKLGLISGYRSVQDQKTIFSQRFQSESIRKIGRAYTAQEISSGQADEVINSVLQTSSIPGYSKHHTGYTIDITDASRGLPFTSFANTPAYKWISQNNYLNAKKFGFIPSYPSGGSNFGPDPEAWEYVWVGEDKLLN